MHVVSDDERREVAAALRECRGGWSSGECYYAIVRALGLPDTSREDGGHALYGALADLIEPSCDRDALLALAEDVDEAAAMAVVMDDSEGAKLLAELLLDIARRIREALGVTDG